MHNAPKIVRIFGGGLAIALVAAGPALAEHTRFWRQSNYEEFDKGTAKGVAIRSDGRLVLAPRFADLADANLAYLWTLRVDSKGNLFAAGGSNAKVVRFDEKGKPTTVFESPELAAQALAIDAQDNLYVGTSPDGKVYKVTPAGEKKVFFEPKTKYIWDLVIDRDATLYIATGDKGQIYSVGPDGKGQVFYTSEETHIRALTLDGHGNLLAGTEPNGLVLRIPIAAPAERKPKTAGSAAEEKRQAFVIYETSKKEVTALRLDSAGNLYAAAIGEKARPIQPLPQLTPTPLQQPTVPTAAQAGIMVTGAMMQQQAAPTTFVPFPPLISSAVYRIAPDGSPDEVWSSREDLVYALGFSPTGKLLLGTGNRGTVVELEGDNLFSRLARTASAQVTGFAQGPGGKVYLATANPGKVFALGPDQEPEGTFESQPFDAKIFSTWGLLTWWGENEDSTDGRPRLEMYARSGNTSNPENNWSPWAGPYANRKGESVNCPPARFVQWRVVIRSGPGPAPEVSWVDLAYLPKNVAPSIDAIVLQNPGIRVHGLAAAQAPGAPAPPVQLRLPPAPPSQMGGMIIQPQAQTQPAQRFEPPPQGFAQKGWMAVLWSALDDNEDELAYSIYYRGEGEKNWKLLKDKLEQKFYSWDTSTMPDGAYYLKIVASDGPSNPTGEALTAARESDRFVVDNTPPVVQNLSAMPGEDASVRVRFEARDSSSAIARAQYSLDAGEWTVAFPVGRLTDAPQESYDLALKGLSSGEHTLAVRVYDQFENLTSAKVTFTVPPAKR